MTDPLLGPCSPLVPPLYQSSVYNFPDLDALDRVMNGAEPGFIYSRDGHPNAASLAAKLSQLEAARWTIVCGSGMAALSACFLGTLSAGDRVIASESLYGRTTKLLREELNRFGVKTTSVNVSDLEAVRKAFAEPARVLYAETMSNPLCRTPDLPKLAEIAHAHRAKLVVDNTFATPVLVRPLEQGADLVMESLTKMIGGHSDLSLGSVSGNDPALVASISQIVSTWGLAAHPFDCWMCERGLATLELRVRASCANAAQLADWLPRQAQVSRVIYPGREDHPDHTVARRILGQGFGNMLCFELKGGREAVNRFMRQATGIPFSPSLGHVATTISHPETTSHRYESPGEKLRQGITDGLIRMSVGVERFERIRDEIANGLSLV
ncbi:MAG: aminotransferase class I/II-fold pyridoxal phosphate-dependent enzyme [Gemmataceae bacterium]|nr:aminotransferase class I/II-fold pyridoxal phosphate-dependent enzyme [Gemmataceae bacterium]